MIDYLQKFRLDSKTAYIVGGLGLIGTEVSIALASSGAKTIILDLDSEKGQAFENKMFHKGFDVTFRSFDCANLEQIDNDFSNRLKEDGSPDVFINCSYPRTDDFGNSSFSNITFKSFRENVDVHMNSYSWLARLAAEAMVNKGNGGSLIQFGSTYGIVGQDLTVYKGTDMEENMTYASIKGGITNLSRLMASYYGEHNIRVNTLCPGGLVGHVAGKSDTQNPIFVKQYSEKLPLKRMGHAEEIASTVLFLSSSAASYITGATIMVDGGWTAV